MGEGRGEGRGEYVIHTGFSEEAQKVGVKRVSSVGEWYV